MVGKKRKKRNFTPGDNDSLYIPQVSSRHVIWLARRAIDPCLLLRKLCPSVPLKARHVTYNLFEFL
jgi:hypothetical protein